MPRRFRHCTGRLRLLDLEDRVTPAVFTVTNVSDSGTGSFRQAILDANAATGADTVAFDAAYFAVPRTIAVSSTLTIADDLTIAGPGADRLAIDGAASSYVHVLKLNSAGTIAVSARDVTIARGAGGIDAGNEQLTLDRVVLRDNFILSGIAGNGATITVRDSTFSNNGAYYGGGIYAVSCNVTLDRVTLDNNRCYGPSDGGGYGAAVYFTGNGTSVIRNTTISNNVGEGSNGGGVCVRDFNGSLTILNSTITQNRVTGGSRAPVPFGGGIAAVNSTSVTLVSSLVAGNTASSYSDISSAVIANDCALGDIAGLVSGSGNNIFGPSFGLGELTTNGGPTRTHSVLPGSPLIDAGTNASGLSTDQRGFARTAGAKTDIGAVERDPTIPSAIIAAPDVTTAGAKYTFSVTYHDDTAIDVATLGTGNILVTGPNGFSALALYEGVDIDTNGVQRVATYSLTAPNGPFDAARNGTYTLTVQANQVKNTAGVGVPSWTMSTFRSMIWRSLVVTNTADSGTGSLRDAIASTNAFPNSHDVITFDPAVFAVPQQITLTSGQLQITDDVTIIGPAAAGLTVNGGGKSTVVEITGAYAQPTAISNITITGGNSTFGGGIRTSSPLTLDSVTLSGNTTTYGGGLYARSASPLVMRNCTVSNNTAYYGGGLYIRDCSLTFADGTIAGNSTTYGEGGGIYTYGYARPNGLRVRNSTIQGNSGRDGGGVYLFAFTGDVAISNSTVTGNSAYNVSANGYGGGGIADRATYAISTISVTSSIVSSNSSVNANKDLSIRAGTAPVTVTNSAVGVAAGFTLAAGSGGNLPYGTPLNLGPLQFNGGPTKTIALGAGSPAIDAGSNPGGLTTDQRGLPRVVGTAADIGAFERQAPPAVTAITVNGGAAQRGRVTTIGVTFNGLANLSANAVSLTRPSFDGTSPSAATLVSGNPASGQGRINVTTTVNPAGQTIATLTFATNGGSNTTIGEGVEYGSLSDGSWILTVKAASVTNLDGSAMVADYHSPDGTDNYATSGRIYRLFGDADGDGDVDLSDLAQFRSSFLTIAGSDGSNYSVAFDYDGDGDVDLSDLASFRARFAQAV